MLPGDLVFIVEPSPRGAHCSRLVDEEEDVAVSVWLPRGTALVFIKHDVANVSTFFHGEHGFILVFDDAVAGVEG